MWRGYNNHNVQAWGWYRSGNGSDYLPDYLLLFVQFIKHPVFLSKLI